MMDCLFHPEAERELREAVSWYEKIETGLGLRLSREVEKSIANIMAFPSAWTSLSPNTKRCLTNHFPYGIIYQVRGDSTVIVAVMQLNRAPGYWQERLTAPSPEGDGG